LPSNAPSSARSMATLMGLLRSSARQRRLLRLARPDRARLRAFAEDDVELEDVVGARAVDVHGHRVEIDLLVLGDDLEELLLQLLQVIGRVARRQPFAGDDD